MARGVPFQVGDRIALITYSSIASAFNLFANIRRDSGAVDSYRTGTLTPTADRLIVSRIMGPLGAQGTIEGFVLNRADSTVTVPKHGQTWVIVNLIRSGVSIQNLAAAYWSSMEGPALGVLRTSREGGGLTSPLTLANDIAGNVATNAALSSVNAFRIIRGIVLLYHCSSDVADRTLQVLLRRPFGPGPTGFTNVAAQIAWNSPTTSLQADEEGMLYIGEAGAGLFQTQNDDGTVTISDNTTVPNPFPLHVQEGETATQIRTNFTNGNANDRYSMYAIQEEWLDV